MSDELQVEIGETIIGPFGTAQEILASDEQKKGGVATWFLTCPDQHPFWLHYIFSIVHLRVEEGLPEPALRHSHMTHEVILAAVVSKDGREGPPKPDRIDTWQHLTPLNFVEQVELPSDEAARELAKLLAKAVVDGVLWAEPPLSGQREPWESSLLKSAAHMRGEAHSP